MQVVAREKTNDKATDFKAILTKMKGKNPDAIFYGGMDATGGPMLKQARELGIKAVFAFGDGACTSEMTKLAGAAAEGMICSQAGIPTQMASQGVPGRVQGEVRRGQAIRAVLLRRRQHPDRRDAEGELDRSGQVPARSSRKITFDGATGHIEFDEKGDRKDAEMTIFQMKNGKVVPVAIIKAGKTTKSARRRGGSGARRGRPRLPAAAPAWPRRSPGRPPAEGRAEEVSALADRQKTAPFGAPFLCRRAYAGIAGSAAQCRRARRTGRLPRRIAARASHDPRCPAESAWTSSCSRSSTASRSAASTRSSRSATRWSTASSSSSTSPTARW